MPRWFRLSFFFLFITLHASAIDAVVSHCTFFAGKHYIEVYWQIAPQSLHFIQIENGVAARMKTDIILRNDTGIIGAEHYLSQTPSFNSIKDAKDQTLLNMRRFDVTDGKITIQLKLSGIGPDSTNKYVFTDSVTIAPYSKEPFYSDIELLDTFYTSSQESIFHKNNEQHIPLCANFLDERKDELHYYAELYNTGNIAAEQRPLIQKVYISQKAMESPFQKMITIDSVTHGNYQGMSGSFNISSLPSGNYYLNFSIEDKESVVLLSKSLFFQRSNVKPVSKFTDTGKASADTGFVNVTMLDLSKTFMAKYTLVQLKAMMKMIWPVSTPVEVQAIRVFLKKPDELYMRYFVYNHFSSINEKDPQQAWKEYSDLVREVNKLFGTDNTIGYETDRGFVYLKYGKPTERIRVENEVGALPYEVWQYNDLQSKTSEFHQTNAVFLFFRPSEYLSDMRLLHSTIPGEVRNSQWRTLLYTNGGGSNDPNSRAEQYIGTR